MQRGVRILRLVRARGPDKAGRAAQAPSGAVPGGQGARGEENKRRAARGGSRRRAGRGNRRARADALPLSRAESRRDRRHNT